MMKPSALRVSRLYATSFRLASMSGSGRLANEPNRPGWSWRSSAAASLHFLNRVGASGIGGPDETERIPSLIPFASTNLVERLGGPLWDFRFRICPPQGFGPTPSTL